jgi:hypothetical protein
MGCREARQTLHAGEQVSPRREPNERADDGFEEKLFSRLRVRSTRRIREC